MSKIGKDTLINGIANAYRDVTGTTDKIKAGQLVQNIKKLSGFEDKIEYAIVKDENSIKLLSKCTKLKKVFLDGIHNIGANSPELAPFKNADSSLIIYTSQSEIGYNWGSYYNYVNGNFVQVEFNTTEEQFKRICLGYDKNSFHYEYVDSKPVPGKHYLITAYTPTTLPRGPYNNKLYQKILIDNIQDDWGRQGLYAQSVEVAEEDKPKIYLDYPDSVGRGEWACLPGTVNVAGNNKVPSTYMFQNVISGKYLFNPCFEEGHNENMSLISDPLTDNYSPFSRQVFNSQDAIYSFFKDSNEDIHLSYNPSEPKCIEAGTNQYSGAGMADPWIKFNCAGIDGFEDLAVVYYNHNINGQLFQLFTFFNVPSNDFHVANLESKSPNSWHVFHSYDSLQAALHQRGLLESYRIDLDLKDGRYWLANAICTKNIYARLMLHHYLLNHAKYNAGGYYPSHNFAFCQFAEPKQESNEFGEICNTSIRNADSRDSNEFSHQWNYGFKDDGSVYFAKEWYDPGNQNSKAFQLWEKVEHDTPDMYQWVPISSEEEIINGEDCAIGCTYKYFTYYLTRDGEAGLCIRQPSSGVGPFPDCLWRFYKVGDYYYINGEGKNLTIKADAPQELTINSFNEVPYLRLRNDAIGNLDRYHEKYRWKYDAKNSKLVAYNIAQNPNENIKTTKVDIKIGESNFYIYKKVLKNPNNIKIYNLTT